LTDDTNLIGILQSVQPDEVYNLGAQSHVGASSKTAEYTATPTPWARYACWNRSKGCNPKARFCE
jgi:GDP-D-mannose dehydratase